jgi:uracil-DNA glycosylase family 4
MDANEALRRYLEQRRELGESELVLDSLTVEQAMTLLGAAKTMSKPDAARTTSKSQQAAEPTDWRAAIRAAGGAPEARPSIGTPAIASDVVSPAASTPLAPATPAPAVPLEQIPSGIVVGSRGRESRDELVEILASLEEIATMVAKCTRCSLYATATKPVPGSGNPNADFMCVGEAPGADEDLQGVPFVGRAGQLLTKILEAINLKREDVFIANVLKHRPPGNRNPAPEEVAACSPYLVRQIERVRPKVILALGTFAAQTLLETKLTIGKLRGQIHRYHDVPLIVTYHPAALLRNPAWKRPTWEDVQLARRIFDQ